MPPLHLQMCERWADHATTCSFSRQQCRCLHQGTYESSIYQQYEGLIRFLSSFGAMTPGGVLKWGVGHQRYASCIFFYRHFWWSLHLIFVVSLYFIFIVYGTVCCVDLLYSLHIYILNLISTYLSCHPHFMSDLRWDLYLSQSLLILTSFV